MGETIEGLTRDAKHILNVTSHIEQEEQTSPSTIIYNYGLIRFNNNGNCDVDKYCQIKACEAISCSRIKICGNFDPGEAISIFIEKIFKVKCSSKSSINLILEKSTFSDNKLQENWLKIKDIEIVELILTNCLLTTLSDGAFSSSIFNRMRKLQLQDNNISILKKATFDHLPNLEKFSIVNNEIKEAEKNLLQNVKKNLATIELENAITDTEVLRNITGGENDLFNVKLLALRYNRITILDYRLFTGVPNIESLYLHFSNIETVSGADTFKPISGSIKQIFINNNRITTLPEGLFDFIKQNSSFFELSIHDNWWHCDCSLKWMQDLMIQHSGIVKNIPTCKTPREKNNQSFLEVNFCDQTKTTETSSSNTTHSSVTSTSHDISTSSSYHSTTEMPNYRPVDYHVIIPVFVSSLIVMGFLSALLMFVIVRRHPTILRGSKRIVIVKREIPDVMILPKGVSSDAIESMNKNTISTISRNLKEDEYIVPLPPIRNPTRKNSRSSASSVPSDTSYISSIEPTLSQLDSWQLKRSKYTSRETESPPLPPYPHPNIAQPLSIVLDMDENDFNSCTV
ncbi:PREDICTED: SLIT and NTRK-like protein 1 [Dinoponera quadriceps]|uniref:SLIT and NTRK-like protein 1 n=1 Tax=Dinoponera quadriceps TaxID=609295 RepID=A0A6P3XTZ4_DINQU|nr:PREDICTED: SLIT and NTRK-like protein 1 [Dinoponera quadriceps]